jgi:hypothetical protein
MYILLLYLIEKTFGENVVINYQNYFDPGEVTKMAIGHLSIVLIIVIPFQALYLYLLVTRKWYGYFETMVATIYSLGTIILLQFVFALVALAVHLLFSVSVDLKISDLLKVGYILWFVISFIRLFDVKGKLWSVVAFAILAFGTFTVWRLYGYPAMAELFVGH